MDSEDWCGLDVRTCDGTVLGVWSACSRRAPCRPPAGTGRIPPPSPSMAIPPIGRRAQAPGQRAAGREPAPSSGRMADACATGKAHVTDAGRGAPGTRLNRTPARAGVARVTAHLTRLWGQGGDGRAINHQRVRAAGVSTIRVQNTQRLGWFVQTHMAPPRARRGLARSGAGVSA
jgi:hypothetical protein